MLGQACLSAPTQCGRRSHLLQTPFSCHSALLINTNNEGHNQGVLGTYYVAPVALTEGPGGSAETSPSSPTGACLLQGLGWVGWAGGSFLLLDFLVLLL